jgi:hypothetical protein
MNSRRPVNSNVMFLLLFIVIAIVPAQFRDPGDCLCETFGSDKDDFANARRKAAAIFSGRVLKIDNVVSHGWSQKRVKLKVNSFWKGRLPGKVTIFTRGGCETTFLVGEEYLVLAYVPDGERALYTDHCMRSGLVRRSAHYLEWLGKAKHR